MVSTRVIRAVALLAVAWSVCGYATPPDEKEERFERAYCVKCHSTQVRAIERTPHGNPDDARTPFANEQCESCHGDTSVHLEFSKAEEADFGEMLTFKTKDRSKAAKRNNACLQCHQGGERIHWQGGAHDTNDIACIDCHKIHDRDHAINKETQASVCFTCHKNVKIDFLRPYAHPSNEKISCSDCHKHHGSAGPKELKRFDINEVCYDCHAEKRGPFLWEHPPASEECVSCHRPHGSNHFALLKSRPPFLCQQCHQNQRGPRHVRQAMEYTDTPGRSRFIVGSACMNCHSKVHGSNHPSGFSLKR